MRHQNIWRRAPGLRRGRGFKRAAGRCARGRWRKLMHCPTLAELPPPPEGKTGWPWTVETPRLPPARPDGSPWPRISIVTPSYNQGQFIEVTIR